MKNKNNQASTGSNSSLSLEYDARETLKEHGWQKYHRKSDKHERADGLEFIMFSHYQRSLENYQETHPSFDEYAAHWLAANGDNYAEEVIEILINRYGPVKGEQMIAPHMSYWE
jgi:hypothetical protein